MSLADARKARDATKSLKSDGHDPVRARKLAKLRYPVAGGDTFKSVALAWHSKQVPEWSPGQLSGRYASWSVT